MDLKTAVVTVTEVINYFGCMLMFVTGDFDNLEKMVIESFN